MRVTLWIIVDYCGLLWIRDGTDGAVFAKVSIVVESEEGQERTLDPPAKGQEPHYMDGKRKR
eukprot:SAG11_NODE_891_length_6685_cov_4.256909_5_plen_62_part_00